MSERFRESVIPEPVSSQDIEVLTALNTKPEFMDLSRELAEKIAASIGGVASSETIVVGLLSLNEAEKSLLVDSRKKMPTLLS